MSQFFLFLSGYGFSITGIKSKRYYADKILRFYINYWLVFIVFIPIGLIFYSSNPRYFFKTSDFIYNMLGLSNSYNGEWWFVKVYIILVISIIFVNYFRYKSTILLFISFIMFLSSAMLDSQYGLLTSILKNILYWQLPFITGYLFGIHEDISLVGRVVAKIWTNNNYMISSYLIVVILSFMFLKVVGLLLTVPLFIVFLMRLQRFLPKYIVRSFIELGSCSMYMWLTHSFFCYYFFSNFIYSGSFSLFIFVKFLCVSYAIGKVFFVINPYFYRLMHKLRIIYQ